MKVAYFDLETTNLKADVGRLLCGSVLCYDGSMHTVRWDEMATKKELRHGLTNDEKVAVAVRDLLNAHHVVCGWFSKGFDVPFLNTRLAAFGNKLVERHLHIDGIWYMKGWRGLGTRSAKLAVAAEFFGLDERKMDVDVNVWVRGQAGEREAMDVLVERCESDVRLLQKVVQRQLDLGLVRQIQSYP